eukprot:scaffold12966_cov38-Attheya_sp.AAC.5
MSIGGGRFHCIVVNSTESTSIIVRALRMTQNQTPEAPPGMGLDDQQEEATAFWRALTLSDFSAAWDVFRKVTPITTGAFVFPEAGEDMAVWATR